MFSNLNNIIIIDFESDDFKDPNELFNSYTQNKMHGSFYHYAFTQLRHGFCLF